ncbi:hypothetical protein [Porticoccus sp.]|uniref:hypothetical protein n=1 Tax=Porticoccus sp. TaxID=2024853 RepID=UPI000C4364FB|nr:hypothetical protein [Porticoccus sp.]MAZ69973.1 hypothetical protein [Porticoccus sp.]|tara:strand:+ start:2021 stop:2332 length:312 start_codon:yes stop_codon:yes gene_type:complete
MKKNKDKDPKVQQVIEEFGLPKNTKFLGFVCHLPASDEFLHEVKRVDDIEGRLWGAIPRLAHKYQTHREAKKEVDLYGDGAVVALLFDVGPQYIVIIDEDYAG